MTADDAHAQLTAELREIALLGSIGSVLGWDERTQLPAKGTDHRAAQATLLARLVHDRFTSPKVGDLLAALEASKPTDDAAAVAREVRRDYDRATKLPPKLVEEQTRTAVMAQAAWAEARAKSNFAAFAPWLEKILALSREQAECWGYTTCRYDALLEGYEPGARAADLAPVFADLQKQLSPLLPALEKITGAVDPARLEGEYPVETQRLLNREIAAAIGFDFEAGRIDTTVHPFCTEMGPRDCRLTTRYDGRDFTSSLSGTMHEAGHGLYTQGLDAAHFGTPVGTYVSLGIHESQSRLWENQVGRSRAFWAHWYPRVQQIFPSLASLPLEEFWLLVNRVKPSHIRVEADEVTYNLHIILRFEIEQKLLSGDLPVNDLPAAWNQRFEQIFGLAVPDDARGCLQDTHWALGLIGYFPTYTLGNLNSAQLYAAALKQDVAIGAEIEDGRYTRLLAWMREKIHRHGRRYSPPELIERATGEPLRATYFIDYLKTKYGLN